MYFAYINQSMPYIICIFCLYYLIEYQCNLRVKRTLKRLLILIYQSCLNKRSKFIEKKLKDQDWRQLLFELKFLVPSIITPKPRPKICEITGCFFLRKPFLLLFFSFIFTSSCWSCGRRGQYIAVFKEMVSWE